MFQKIIDRIANALCESSLINNEDKAIYRFGIEATLLKCIHIITMLIMGVAFGLILETFVFIITYSILRIYAGGFHSKTRIGCYIISWIMILSVLLLIKFCSNQLIFVVLIVVSILSCFIILILSPVGNVNKQLDDIEIQHYKAKTRIILSIEIIISMIFLLVNISQISISISFSILSVAIMLILGKVQLKHIANDFSV